jgi:hypothetical protein
MDPDFWFERKWQGENMEKGEQRATWRCTQMMFTKSSKYLPKSHQLPYHLLEILRPSVRNEVNPRLRRVRNIRLHRLENPLLAPVLECVDNPTIIRPRAK